MQEQSARSPQGFEFRGSAGEWFGIWIVNLVLTILTVGIYSAWAKVRRNKYFYQNTYVAGRNFDYHATGLQILIGRIIIIVGFVVFSVVSAIPLVGLVALLALLVALPWLLVRSMKFNAQMSSWSNVRFRFLGGYGGAFLTYIVYPILCAITLYLTFPFLDRARKRFTMNNHSLGKHGFAFDAPIGGFYRAFFVAAAWIIGVTLVVVALTFPGIPAIQTAIESEDPMVIAPMVIGVYVWVFLALIPAATIYTAMVRNVSLSNLELEGGHAFHSNVSPGRLIWITVSNALITAVSLGLMLPWAQVRVARYLATHTILLPGPSLDNFLGQIEAESTALGDAYTDLEGFEVGMPV
ncbi:MAG: YjgN family protein [Pseudomonadota bacterium]